jgi:hypothetical protein
MTSVRCWLSIVRWHIVRAPLGPEVWRSYRISGGKLCSPVAVDMRAIAKTSPTMAWPARKPLSVFRPA